jgi:hypothetical protein
MVNSRRGQKKFLDIVSVAHYIAGMKTDTTPPLPTDRLKNSLEELRASVVGQETNKGLAGLLHEVMLGVLKLLMALVVDFRAGKLVPPAPSAREDVASDGGVSVAVYPSPSRCAGGRFAYPSPSRCAGPSSVRFAAQPLKGRGIQGHGRALAPCGHDEGGTERPDSKIGALRVRGMLDGIVPT